MFDSPEVSLEQLENRQEVFDKISNELRKTVAKDYMETEYKKSVEAKKQGQVYDPKPYPKPPVEMNACRVDNLRQSENYIGTREAEEFHLNETHQQLILDTMNLYRNHFACGEANLTNVVNERFPNAAKMPKLRWSHELSTSARFFASKCRYVRECGKTYSFPRVGHTMVQLGVPYKNNNRTTEDYIKLFLFKWFGEYVNFLTSNIANFTNIRANYRITHSKHYAKLKELGWRSNLIDSEGFPQMVDDRADQVGCAFYSCGMQYKKKQLFFSCKWSARKYKFGTLYVKSETFGGAQCKKRSSKFCCLCLSDKEEEETAKECDDSNKLKIPVFTGTGTAANSFCLQFVLIAIFMINC